MDLTLQVRDGAANKGKKKKKRGNKKKEENHNVSQLLPWLVDKIRAFLRVYTHGQDILFCGDEYLGTKIKNQALRGVTGHWGVSSGDWILVHFWGDCGQCVLWGQTDGFGVGTQFLGIYSDTKTAFQTHPATQELEHQSNFSALTCMSAALQGVTHIERDQK